MSDKVRYLPETITLAEEEDGLLPARTITYYPGLVDVDVFPELEPYTVAAPYLASVFRPGDPVIVIPQTDIMTP